MILLHLIHAWYRITASTCHAVGVGSILSQISHDSNPIRVESLRNYVIKMYWFKLEGSNRLGWLVPWKTLHCALSGRGGVSVGKKRRWSIVCPIHSVSTPLGCKAHSESVQTTAKVIKTCHCLSAVSEATIRLYRDWITSITGNGTVCIITPPAARVGLITQNAQVTSFNTTWTLRVVLR